MTLSFRHRLREGRPLIGALLQMPLPEVAEIYAHAGYDWLFVDLEHSPMEARQALDIITAVDSRVPCVVRVPWNDEAHIKKALDIGATGIIVPLVNTVEDAKRAVDRCKYPPQGVRSVGITRAQRFDLDFDGYMQRANDEVAVIVQIEHVDAARNIDAILDVPGIDGVFVGPFDLSASPARSTTRKCSRRSGTSSAPARSATSRAASTRTPRRTPRPTSSRATA